MVGSILALDVCCIYDLVHIERTIHGALCTTQSMLLADCVLCTTHQYMLTNYYIVHAVKNRECVMCST